MTYYQTAATFEDPLELGRLHGTHIKPTTSAQTRIVSTNVFPEVNSEPGSLVRAILLNIRESERKAVSRRDTMVQRRQRGWLKKESRIPGETWVLYFRTTRKSDGRRVENKIPIGLIRDLPDKHTAWAEVERLHLPINPVDSRRGAHCT
jgi:hypothetical protein